jgi:outer membrane protein TolC
LPICSWRAKLSPFLQVLLLCLGLSAPGRAEELSLSLEDTVKLSLSSNLVLRTAAFEPALAKTEIMGESGIFDPEFFAEYRWAGFAQALPAQLDSFLHRRANNGGAGIRHRLPTGWTYSIEYRNSLERSSFDIFGIDDQRDLFATLVVPLLRGAGVDVTRAGIDIAMLSHKASVQAFEQTSLDLVLEVERAYWSLVQARLVESVRRRAVEGSRQFLQLLSAEIKEGEAAPYEAFEAEQNVYNQQRDLEQGLQDVALAQNALSRLLGIDPGTMTIVPTQPAAVLAEAGIELEPAFLKALDRRPLLRQADLALQVIDKQLLLAKNQILPRLDAVGEHRLGDSRADPYAWQVGLQLSVILGNREARARYDFVRLSQEQAQVRLQDLRQRVRLEVAQAVSALQISTLRAQSAEAASDMGQKRVDAELARFRAGFTPSHRVIFAQQQQLVSDEEAAVALISLELARSELRWATGSAIADFGLQLVPAAGGSVDEEPPESLPDQNDLIPTQKRPVKELRDANERDVPPKD